MIKHRLLAAWLVLLEAAPALAAEGGHGEHGAEHHGIPWLTLFFTSVNFFLFLLLIWRLALPGLRTWAIDRHDRIVEDLEKAASARSAAERLQAEWEARMRRLDREVIEIRNQALADAQRERERILKAAQALAADIARDAEKAVAQELRQAQAELRQQVGREAVNLAREIIQKRINETDQKRFVDEFLRSVQP